MKTAMIIYEGIADRAIPSLEGRTPMQVARCSLATGATVTGTGGLIDPARAEDDNRPEMRLAQFLGVPTGEARHIRRGPLEALGAGVPVESGRWVYRADFVTLDRTILTEASVKRLSMKETEALTAAVQAQWDPAVLTLTVVRPGRVVVQCRVDGDEPHPSVSPFAVEGSDYQDVLPRIRRHALVRDILQRSYEALQGHPVNEVRVDLGENPANALWPWGGGPVGRPAAARTKGGMATQCLMARGLALWLDMPVVDLADPWADINGKRATFKISGLLEALREHDHVTVYIEAPHGGGRYGKAPDKVWALEALDHYVLGPVLTLLEAYRPFRILLAADGAVLTKTGRPVPDPIPFIVSGEGIEPDGVGHWDEEACAHGALGRMRANELMNVLRKE